MNSQQQLHDRILSAITRGAEDREIDELFLELYRHHFEANPPYRRFCERLGHGAESVKSWEEIPALVTDAFKFPAHLPSAFQGEAESIFRTSGTTNEVRGTHRMKSADLYRASVLNGWRHCGPERVRKTFFLSRPPEELPQSSLVAMFGHLAEDWDCPKSAWIASQAGFDFSVVEGATEPVALLGTALAFLELFEQLGDEGLPLPAGSWAMETGGYKGRKIALTKEALYERFERSLGLKEEQIWNEYSMTELSSQFFTRGLCQPHRAPPWLRFRLARLNPLDEFGYLVIYDLANFWSAPAIQTQDLAVPDGAGFQLIGRDPAALPRGCSRAL